MSTEATTNIMRVSAKIPPFWEAQPELWFAQVEAQFATAGITVDETKFSHVIGNMDGKILSKVSEIVINPPATDKYQTLKTRLLSAFAESDQKKSHKLLTEQELGDRKPSELLNEMKKLAGNKVTNEFMRTLWTRCLPNSVSAILSTSEADLDGLAKMADKIMEVGDFRGHIAAISTSSTNATDDRIARLEKKIDELSKHLRNISTNRSRSRSKTPAKKPDITDNSDKPYCWYHFKYADKANKCIPPCTYPNAKN